MPPLILQGYGTAPRVVTQGYTAGAAALGDQPGAVTAGVSARDSVTAGASARDTVGAGLSD